MEQVQPRAAGDCVRGQLHQDLLNQEAKATVFIRPAGSRDCGHVFQRCIHRFDCRNCAQQSSRFRLRLKHRKGVVCAASCARQVEAYLHLIESVLSDPGGRRFLRSCEDLQAVSEAEEQVGVRSAED